MEKIQEPWNPPGATKIQSIVWQDTVGSLDSIRAAHRRGLSQTRKGVRKAGGGGFKCCDYPHHRPCTMQPPCRSCEVAWSFPVLNLTVMKWMQSLSGSTWALGVVYVKGGYTTKEGTLVCSAQLVMHMWTHVQTR